MKTTAYVGIQIILLAWVGLAAGAVLHVNAGGTGGAYPSIQAAINAASNGDEIEVAPGTYGEAVNFIGKSVHLRSSGGSSVTMINGNGAYHVVQCTSGEGLGTILEGFTITGGNANGAGGNNCEGAGMYNANSSPTVSNCIFQGNSSKWFGGGMCNASGSPTVSNCTFTGNSAASHGGGMYNTVGSPNVTHCTFSNNSASANGGAMYNYNVNSSIVNCAFSGNSAKFGGAIYNDQGGPSVVGCSFNSNITTSTGQGGGIYNTGRVLTVINCIFTSNSAYYGGGIRNYSGGGATIVNCTFTGSTAVQGGVVYSGSGCSSTIINCILWGNSLPQAYGTTSVDFSDVQGGWAGTGNINVTPGFVGGGDLHLAAGSPCIDMGTNSPTGGLPAADIEGHARSSDGNGDGLAVADMGAYEFTAGLRTLTVSSGPGGSIADPGEGVFQYMEGASASVTATAGVNYHFANWTGSAVDAGRVANPTAIETAVTMDGDYTLQANFAIDRHILTTSSTDGGNVTSPGEGNYAYDYGVVVNVVATPKVHYHFVEWTGPVANATSGTTTVTVGSDIAVSAVFAPDKHTLTISSNDGGLVTVPGEGASSYDYGTVVNLVAAPEAHYRFDHWTGPVADSNSPTTTATVTADTIVAAIFAIHQHTLTAGTDGNGSATGSGTYDYGSTVPITAMANAHYNFVNWTTSGSVIIADADSAGTTVVVGENGTVTAHFAIDHHTLTTSSGDGGSVTMPGESTYNCDWGSSVPIRATANAHYQFWNWMTSGSVIVADADSASTTATINGNGAVTAEFILKEHSLTISSNDGGSVTAPGEGIGSYDYGTTINLTATPDEHYHFVDWTGPVTNSSSASTSITIVNDMIVQAIFAIDQHGLAVESDGNGSATGSGTYEWGSSTAIAATPNANYHFVNWITSGSVTVADSDAANTTVTINGQGTATAHFAVDQRKLTTSSTLGGTVSVPGVGLFQYGYATVAPVTATADPNHHFVNWTGTAVDAGKVANSAASATTVIMDADYSLRASFAIDQHTLTTSSNNGGSVTTPGEGTSVYDHGTAVNLVATPDEHYHFVGWTGPVADSGAAGTTIMITGDTVVQATFAIDHHNMAVGSDSNGSATGSGTYDWGNTVAITATANANYHFVNWTTTGSVTVVEPTSASTIVTVNGNGSVTAHFAIDQHSLAITSTDGGLVTTPAEGPSSYDYGTMVILAATPDEHYHFVHWIGPVADPASANTTVVVNDDTSVEAVFAIDQFTVVVTSTIGGTVVEPGIGSFICDYGTVVNLQVQPVPLFKFAGWTGSYFGSAEPASLTVTTDHHIRINFVSLLDTIYVSREAAGDPNVNGTAEHPFSSIQAAIEVAREGTQILVDGGTYREQLNFMGKNLRVQGLWLSDPNITQVPVVDGNGIGPVVTFKGTEDANCLLAGFAVQGGYGPYAAAILCLGGPTIVNCLIAGNRTTDLQAASIHCSGSSASLINCTITENAADSHGALIVCVDSSITMTNSILWANMPPVIRTISGAAPAITYCDVEGGWPGEGNLDADPAFVMPGIWTDAGILGWPVDDVWTPGDYHLQSQAGRWDATGIYIKDAVSSPCIDAGDPATDSTTEPSPNGSKVNMGVYSGTGQASLVRE